MSQSFEDKLIQLSNRNGMTVDQAVVRLNRVNELKIECLKIFNKRGLEFKFDNVNNCVERMWESNNMYIDLLEKINTN